MIFRDDLQREDGDSWGLQTSPIVNERAPSWDLSRRQFVQVINAAIILTFLATLVALHLTPVNHWVIVSD